MKENIFLSGCACCPMSRRGFLAKSGAAAIGALGMLAAPDLLSAANSTQKMRIRIIYALHAEKQPGPDWPNKGFDFVPVMQRINSELTRRCKGFEFVPSMANGEEQAKKLLEEDSKAGNVDGYLVYQMNCWNRVVQAVAATGKPVLYADFQFGGSGGFLVYNAAFLRSQAPNVGFVASSRIKDVAEAVKCFETAKKGTVSDFVAATARVRIKNSPGPNTFASLPDIFNCLSANECLTLLKEAKLLAVRDQSAGAECEIMGMKVQRVPFAELNDAWKQADQDKTRAVADQWTKSARKIQGVPRETLEASAAMYLAQKALLKKHAAMGITINCLGGFYGGHIHAYPCLGFHQLNNDALVGGCECDVRSSAAMVLGNLLTLGRPGFISDPVLDSSKGQIIYAHCVASNKPFGPFGPKNRFEILTHSEDRQGASVRSILPTGYMTTTFQLEPSRKEILLHQALTVANDPDDRACRTKLCAQPEGDFEKLFRMWDQWGWHRVTFYGDLKQSIYALADATGWTVIEEA